MRHLGQAGIEYVILLGVLLFFFIPIIYYSLTESTLQVKMSQAENIVNRLGKAVDAVFALGPGSAEIIPITVPDGVMSTLVGGQTQREIILNLTGFGGISEVHTSTRANITGSLPTTKGTYFIKVETLPSGVVRIQQR